MVARGLAGDSVHVLDAELKTSLVESGKTELAGEKDELSAVLLVDVVHESSLAHELQLWQLVLVRSLEKVGGCQGAVF